MPEIDLSTLSGAELRGLLQSTRQRGQAAQTYQILKEMAERRERHARRAPAHVIELGDPPERLDPEPPPEAPLQVQAEDEPELTFTLDERPAPRGKAARRRTRRDDPPPPPPRRRIPVLGFSMGLALGLIVGVGVGIQSRALPPEPAAAAFPQAPDLRPQTAPPMAAAPASEANAGPAQVQPPSADTAPIPADDTSPVPGPPTAVVAPATPASPATPATASAATTQAQPAPPPAAEPAAPVAVAESRPAETRPAESRAVETAQAVEKARTTPSPACASAPTPADRTICGDPRLRTLQTALRRAYARALAASADRGALRQRQLAWRDTRSDVTDPDRLARIYKTRTRQLESSLRDTEPPN